MTTVDVECACCGCGSSLSDDNSPCEELFIIYFEDGWRLGEPTLCPDCAPVEI